MLLHRLLASALIPLSGLPRDMEQVGHDRDAGVLVAGGEGDLDEAKAEFSSNLRKRMAATGM